jgi:tetratricopeptide (TPR) repeat protein
VAEALSIHSAALRKTGQTDLALSEARRAQTIFAQTLGTNHGKYSFALLDLGHIYTARGEYARAIAAYRESIAVLKRSQVTDVWCLARPQLGIARAELALHEAPAAIAMLEETLAMLDRYDPTSMFLPDTCFELAKALSLTGPGHDEARVKALLERAISLYEKVDFVRQEQRLSAQRFLQARPAVKN